MKNVLETLTRTGIGYQVKVSIGGQPTDEKVESTLERIIMRLMLHSISVGNLLAIMEIGK